MQTPCSKRVDPIIDTMRLQSLHFRSSGRRRCRHRRLVVVILVDVVAVLSIQQGCNASVRVGADRMTNRTQKLNASVNRCRTLACTP